MKTKLINWWESLKTSFWFIPTLMVLAAIVISIGIISLDRGSLTDYLRSYGFFNSVSPEGARSILSTLAASMMTVTGVTFSITIVVLNLASSQFGPRLLRNFIRDKSIQFVLGTFVASFIYCLIVLRSIQAVGTDIFVPNLSVTFAVGLALLDVGVLIYFIHHIATSIQADEVVAGVSAELERNIRRIFTTDLDDQPDEITDTISQLQEENKAHYNNHTIIADRKGYLQAIDLDGLLQTAKENDYLIRLHLRPGQFVVADGTLAVVSSEKEFDINLTGSITKAFIVGSNPTPEQDIEYSIHQLVEVAIRALSPGINDPFTAMACVDQLGTALCCLAKRKFPSSNYFDDQGQLRVKTKPFIYSGVLNASFDQIRQYGRSSMAVTIRLLETLLLIAEQTLQTEQRKAIHRQATMILRASQETVFEQNDREDVQNRYELLLCTLNKFDDADGSYAFPEDLSA
ncbi:DUF2254 domain-containing protein [Desulfocastanea catecholica]